MFLGQSTSSSVIVLQSIFFHFLICLSLFSVCTHAYFPLQNHVTCAEWLATVQPDKTTPTRAQMGSGQLFVLWFLLSRRYLSRTLSNINGTSKYHAAQESGHRDVLLNCLKGLTSDGIMHNQSKGNTSYSTFRQNYSCCHLFIFSLQQNAL